MFLSPEQSSYIGTYIESLPGRVLVDMISHVGSQDEFVRVLQLPIEDAEDTIIHWGVTWNTQFMCIMNELRALAGMDPWLAVDSYLPSLTRTLFSALTNMEADIGFTTNEIDRYWYTIEVFRLQLGRDDFDDDATTVSVPEPTIAHLQ